ncbi:MAG: hypothetical protein AAGB04_03270 [Pseudomonadota bacterium]
MQAGLGLRAQCRGERLTAKQQTAGLAVTLALIERFDQTSNDVFGHGALQTNRAPTEGITLVMVIGVQCLQSAFIEKC